MSNLAIRTDQPNKRSANMNQHYRLLFQNWLCNNHCIMKTPTFSSRPSHQLNRTSVNCFECRIQLQRAEFTTLPATRNFHFRCSLMANVPFVALSGRPCTRLCCGMLKTKTMLVKLLPTRISQFAVDLSVRSKGANAKQIVSIARLQNNIKLF